MRLPKWGALAASSLCLRKQQDKKVGARRCSEKQKRRRTRWHREDGNQAVIKCCLGMNWSLNDYLRHTVPSRHLSEEACSCQPWHGASETDAHSRHSTNSIWINGLTPQKYSWNTGKGTQILFQFFPVGWMAWLALGLKPGMHLKMKVEGSNSIAGSQRI